MEESQKTKYFKLEYFIVSSITLLIVFIGRYVYKKNRRIRVVTDLPRNYLDYSISGIVTSVSDGDGFKLFHTPLLRSSEYKSSDPKLSIRLTGIDAPETRWFGTPEQPFALEAKEYLSRLILHKKVHVQIKGIDRYNRVLAIVFVGSFCNRVNVNLKVIEEGYACVYLGRDGVYGDYKNEMTRLEANAREAKKGMLQVANLVSPMEYKKARKNRKPNKSNYPNKEGT